MNVFDLFIQANILVQISICILISFSVISWSIIFNRIFLLKIEKRRLNIFENRFWSGIELSRLYNEMLPRRNQLNTIERIFYVGFKEFSQLYQMHTHCLPESITNRTLQVMSNIMNVALKELENYISLIGTIGSVSPYIGLFGTVLGIIHVFFELGGQVANIAYHHSVGNIQIIAPGIAEALISTSLGLFVAIPAVIAFNYLTTQINRIDQSYNNFMKEFITILYNQIFSSSKFDKNIVREEHE